MKPVTKSATNRPFACRAKCQWNPAKVAGGSGLSGKTVGFSVFSNHESITRHHHVFRVIRSIASVVRAARQQAAPSTMGRLLVVSILDTVL